MSIMSIFSDIAIIYNPNSTGDAPQNARQLKADLVRDLPAVPVTLLPTEKAGHAVKLAYDFAKAHKSPLIVSASGDGGYNEVINGALQAQGEGAKPICAVLPSGNANDHARTMQDKPLGELITREAVTGLDVLEVTTKDSTGENSRYAHSYVGIGLTPTVAVELNKHTLNSFREAWIIMKTFWNLRPVVIRIESKRLELDSLICSTIPEMAKVLTISDTSKPQDGMFEVTTFPHNKKITLVFRLIKGIFTHLGAQKRSSKLTFTLLEAVPMQLDGEIMELSKDTDVTVTICPRLLHTVA
jgi:diacylglycerol kinase (ATP)